MGGNRLLLRALVLVLLLLGASTTMAADESLERRLQVLERRVSHVSELVLEVEGLKRSNRELLGRVEELEYRIKRMEQKQRELYLDLDSRLSALQPNGSRPAAKVPAAEKPSAAAPGAVQKKPTAAGAVSPAKIQAEYDAAYALLQPSQRRYKEAIAAFKAFLEKYPTSELADNALYWLGETYYVTEDNKSALAAFDRLLKEFPQSDKAPGALLKKGYILDAMGRKSEARKVLQQLVSQYPDASVSRMAKARLKKLK
ncbi:MAG: tol-pal system protein YbgF [Gammaproteobacteria bacterium]|nr:MAG: tol-pal system protein YbgF [Gammaproteobacteria bacterium]RTZ80834.1 MAG: tol-pal system protein YbgF [Gammaproteobacteria bacterium]